jgi:hypothetical protein
MLLLLTFISFFARSFVRLSETIVKLTTKTTNSRRKGINENGGVRQRSRPFRQKKTEGKGEGEHRLALRHPPQNNCFDSLFFNSLSVVGRMIL